MTINREISHAVPADAIVTAEPIVAQPIGMMQRHIALDSTATYQWLGRAVRIDTNSPAILRAANEWGFSADRNAVSGFDLHLEFVVEDMLDRAHDASPSHVLRDERTVFIETGQLGWFAFDFETGDGAGFFAATESEDTVKAYFGAVAAALEPLLRHPSKGTGQND